MAAHTLSDLQWADLIGRIKNKADSSSLSAVATSGEYSALLNKPALKTVATSGDYKDLTNKPLLKPVATSGEYSDLLNTPALKNVATSGDYNDLTNKPTIPTPGNGKLTIQRNGVNLNTFNANQSTDVTINIAVPTSAADVSALPSSTKYGAAFAASINSSTYVISMSLKDQDGNTLGTTQNIDLPLESVVVNGSYNATTKNVVLGLQGGTSIEFSVADLVSGLQSEINSTHKLNADLVSDGASHKFVSSAQLSKLTNLANIKSIGDNLTLQANGRLDAKDTTYGVFSATANGLVPAASGTGDATKYLRGDGTWQTVSAYSLPPATASSIGGVIIGDGLNVAANGLISVSTFNSTEWNALWA